MQREFEAFVKSPTRAKFFAARQSFCSRDSRLVTLDDLERLSMLLDELDFVGVRESLVALPPLAALSPRVHFFAAEAAAGLGDVEDCLLERFLYATCVRGLVGTGSGFAKRPFVVSAPSDILDILDFLQETAVSRTLIEQDQRLCDVVTIASGREVWFDVGWLSLQRPARTIVRQIAVTSTRPARKRAKKRTPRRVTAVSRTLR